MEKRSIEEAIGLDMAIVGMSLCLSECRDMKQFYQVIFDNAQIRETPPAFSQEELLVDASDRALADAGLKVGKQPEKLKIIKISPQQTDFPLRSSNPFPNSAGLLDGKIGRSWNQFSFAAPQEVECLAYGLQCAQAFLSNKEADVVLMVGGSGAIVLEKEELAITTNQRIYAILNSIGFSTLSGKPENAPLACSNALSKCLFSERDIEYIETFASEGEVGIESEIQAIRQSYRTTFPGRKCAIGTVRGNVGAGQSAVEMAGLIKTVLCLFHRFLPGGGSTGALKRIQKMVGSGFDTPSESQPWILADSKGKRRSGINLIWKETLFHVILSEHARKEEVSILGEYARHLECLFTLAGDTLDEILAGIRELENNLRNDQAVERMSRESLKGFGVEISKKYALSIVGKSKEGLLKELAFAKTGAGNSFQRSSEWVTPSGSFFTPAPLGPSSLISFVYPGSVQSYVGLGRTLFQLFPGLHGVTQKKVSRPKDFLLSDFLYPINLNPGNKAQLEQSLTDNVPASMISGLSFSYLYTSIAKNIFGLMPNASFGYSMGEASGMLFAQEVWEDYECLYNFNSSELFNHRLVGPTTLLGDLLRMSPGQIRDEWVTKLVCAPSGKVREMLRQNGNAHLQFVNAPDEVVITGDKNAVEKIARELGGMPVDINIRSIMHLEIVKNVYRELLDMHTYETTPRKEISFYSSVKFAKLEQERTALAHNSAQICCQTVDFEKLVNVVYEDGIRVFIETGPGSSCTGWISKTLKGRPHLAVSMNKKGIPDFKSIVILLSKLASHRIPVDFRSFWNGS